MHENLRIARVPSEPRARARRLAGLGALAVAVGVALAGALPASAAVLPVGAIVPVSVDDPGSAFIGGENPSISAEGRYVAFTSESALLPGANGSKQVYLRDLQSGSVVLISHRYDDKKVGGQAFSDHAAVSADGKFVAFTSMATDLVSATLKTNGVLQVYRWDASTGAISPMSIDNTVAANMADRAVGEKVDISDDGTRVVFTTMTALEGYGTQNSDQIFVRDTTIPHTMTMSQKAMSNDGALGKSTRPSISPNGQWVTWVSASSELVPGTSIRGAEQVFVQYRRDEPILVSQRAGAAGELASFDPDVSNDGSVSFGTLATELSSPPLKLGGAQVYVSDPGDGSLTLVSHTPEDAAAPSNGTATETSISADGSTVLFVSDAIDLAKTGGFRQIFQWSRSTNASAVVSVGVGTAGPANAAAFDVQLSSDSRSAAFDSNATDLVSAPTADGNGIESFALGLAAIVQPAPSPTPAPLPVPADGSSGGAAGSGSATTGAAGAGGARLASTGAEVSGIGITGALFLAAGAVATMSMRRRRQLRSARD